MAADKVFQSTGELFVVALGNSVYSWGTVFHWCLHQDSTVSGLSDCGIPFVCLILFSWPALAICAGGGRKGQSIKPGKKKVCLCYEYQNDLELILSYFIT